MLINEGTGFQLEIEFMIILGWPKSLFGIKKALSLTILRGYLCIYIVSLFKAGLIWGLKLWQRESIYDHLRNSCLYILGITVLKFDTLNDDSSY